MEKLIIFCKSWSQDLMRFQRLAESITKHNVENIPFYLSVEKKDQPLFEPIIKAHNCKLINDEDILSHTLACSTHKDISDQKGYLLQQVVKSEPWRLNISQNFLVIDSDSYFIRNFYLSDFLFDDTTPYTIINEGRHQREWAARSGNNKFLLQFDELRLRFRKIFPRQGPIFDFAPTPCIQSAKVWSHFYEHFSKPRGTSFLDQILEIPCETQWYGEYLLHTQVIPIIPREPLFKVFGFKDQWMESQNLNETPEVLKKNFLGIVDQSNWNYELDLYPRPKRSWKTFFLKR
jgi:hypothetical protein